MSEGNVPVGEVQGGEEKFMWRKGLPRERLLAFYPLNSWSYKVKTFCRVLGYALPFKKALTTTESAQDIGLKM